MEDSIPADFGWSEEARLLGEAARRLIEQRGGTAHARAFADRQARFDDALWRDIARAGWPGVLVSEQRGGSAAGFLAAVQMLGATGAALLPAPLVSTLVATAVLERAARADQQEPASCAPALLARVLAGEAVVGCGFCDGDGTWDWDRTSTGARPAEPGHDAGEPGWRLTGQAPHVAFGDSASHVLIAARLEAGAPAGLALFAVRTNAPGVAVTPERALDATVPLAHITLRDAHASAGELIGDGEAIRRMHLAALALLASELVGAATAIVAKTRDHAATREQFDRPIGSFQAVQHPLVDAMMDVERARTLCCAAAAALDADSERAEILARMAKAAASDALAHAADRGVQLQGGYGFTWDNDAHLYFRRAVYGAATLGDAAHHRQHLGEILKDAPESVEP